MPQRDFTALEYVVLGLISMAPQSGYSIVSYFDEGMYSWSASPGSIYPMLKRLEKQGAIEGEMEISDESRPRKIYRLTAIGESALDEWLAEVPKMRPFYQEREMALLRFQFMQQRFSVQQTLKWINAYLDLVRMADAHRDSFARGMVDAMNESGTYDVYSQLVLEAVVMEHNTLRTWLEMARSRLEALAIQTGEYPAVRRAARD